MMREGLPGQLNLISSCGGSWGRGDNTWQLYFGVPGNKINLNAPPLV